jgi:hypothetical protein
VNLLRNLVAVVAMLRDEVAGWLMSTAVEPAVDELRARRDLRDEDLW